jgi:hypothetical protein
MKSSHPRSWAFASVGLLCGCSLINEPNDVNPGLTGSGGQTSGPGNGGAGGTGAGGSGGGAPNEGLIVMGGVTAGTSIRVLSALDPATGEELAREEISAAAVAYDGFTDRWYVFESTSFPVDPTVTGRFQVRTFDRAAREWTTIDDIELAFAIPRRPRDVVVLNGRVLYLAYNETDHSRIDLVAIDTASSPPVLLSPDTDVTPVAERSLFGINGYPSGITVGGTINLMEQINAACQLHATVVTVVESGVTITGVNADIGAPYNCFDLPSVPSWGVDPLEANTGVILVPPLMLPGAATRITYSVLTLAESGTRTFMTQGGRLIDADVAACQGATTLVVEHLTQQAIFAVPGSGNGVPAVGLLGHPGQTVFYEPASRRVLDFFDGGGTNFTLQAFELGGSATVPTLEVLNPPEWAPPGDLQPFGEGMVAVRQPLPIDCD